jgi:hypothetical protein
MTNKEAAAWDWFRKAFGKAGKPIQWAGKKAGEGAAGPAHQVLTHAEKAFDDAVAVAKQNLDDSIDKAVQKSKKNLDDVISKGLQSGKETTRAEAMKSIRNISAAAGAGSVVGAVASPEDREAGAIRGAFGGILGGTIGAAWGHKKNPTVETFLPMVGAIVGGITGGKTGKKKEQMMGYKYAGVILDWYDDQGATLKHKFPTAEELPEQIKQASIPPKEKLGIEDFALVAIDEGHAFRKYACIDPGTTMMSVLYFMEHGDKLPEGAQKLAAANLVDACIHHQILPPEALTKMAGKAGDVVDITGQSPKPHIKKAASESDDDYAVVSPDGTRKYPIHTWDLVKRAEDYFTDYRNHMHPEARRQFATKLAQKSFIIGYPISEEIRNLGAQGYADDDYMRAAVDMRKVACPQDQGACEFLDELFEKRAEMHPEVYAECLRRVDVDQGLDKTWDHLVIDPWSSTFGVKTASTIVWQQGAERVTDNELHNLARNYPARIQDMFSEDFVKEFQKDPEAMFKSLPDPQKKLLARLANDSSSQGGSETNPSGSPESKLLGLG